VTFAGDQIADAEDDDVFSIRFGRMKPLAIHSVVDQGAIYERQLRIRDLLTNFATDANDALC
jgi:hypothetical protein